MMKKAIFWFFVASIACTENFHANVQEIEKATSRRKEGLPSVAASDDVRPRFFPDQERKAKAPELRLRRKIRLTPESHRPIRSTFTLSVTSKALYVVDPVGNTIREFGLQGNLVRYMGDDLRNRLEMKRAFDVHFSGRNNRLYATDHRGILVLTPEGSFEKRIQLDGLFPFTVTESPKGDLLVGLSSIEGPHAALVRGEKVVKLLGSERRSLLSPQEEFRPNYPPRFFLDTDGSGNIYAVGQVDYEVRKYTADGAYVGDFHVQQDPYYVSPPETVDKERRLLDKDWHDQWKKSWTRVTKIAVVKDRYLVICLQTHQPQEYRLHFYTLDGRPAFSQISSDSGLVGSDDQGNLYFTDTAKEDSPRLLLVYSLGDESPKPKTLPRAGGREPTRIDERKSTSEQKSLAAPFFNVTSLEGRRFNLNQLLGKVVVLNFWFINCPPCRHEIPGLNKLVDELEGKDVICLAFALDGKEALRHFLQKTEFKYHVIPNSQEIAKQFKVSSFPTHIIIDKDGRINSVLFGGAEHREKDLLLLIERLL
ncbi:redoxin domain-containing protein [Acidobacteria bacterium AH-259-L09]|nr:redoxin domain-containing protein [Acidobacteria bacterium AH-259-L09]